MYTLPRILVFVIYFGEFPEYFEFTKKSMEFNSQIDWLFITDQNVDSSRKNIFVQQMLFSDFTKLVQDKFDFPVEITKPYKICDIRPALGKIFADKVKGYDYWGHCDLDLIFGDILSVLPQVAWGSEKILARGSLSFYRNILPVNQLFEVQIESTLDYRRVFGSKDSFYFDEWHGINKKFELSGMSVWNDDNYLFDIDKNHYGLQTTDGNRRGVSLSSGRIFMFDVTQKRQVEGSYIHLQKRRVFVGSSLTNQDHFIILNNTIVAERNSFQTIHYKLKMKIIFFYNRMEALRKKIIRSLILNLRN